MKKYKCTKCKDSFTSRSKLGLHHRWQHPKKKLGRPKGSKNGHSHGETNGTHPTLASPITPLALAEVTSQYRQASEIAAAIAYLQQFGTVDYKEGK